MPATSPASGEVRLIKPSRTLVTGVGRLGRSSVHAVPLRLAFHAPRGGGLVLKTFGWDSPGARFTDAIRPFPRPLQRVLHALAILVQQVDQDVRGLPVGEGLGQVSLFRDACDD